MVTIKLTSGNRLTFPLSDFKCLEGNYLHLRSRHGVSIVEGDMACDSLASAFRSAQELACRSNG